MSVEAMKQAVNMLVTLTSYLDQDAPANITDKADNTIEVLCKAIEQAEKQKPVGWWNGRETAWFEHETDRPVDDCIIPIYTAPPQRQWVGLTDEEILNLYVGITKSAWDCIMYARVIEARLKGMNHEPNKDLCGND
jgi:hypothetical protein